MEHFEIVSKLTLLPLQSSLSAHDFRGEAKCDLSTYQYHCQVQSAWKWFHLLGVSALLKPSKIPLRLIYNYIKDSLDEMSCIRRE